MQEGGRAPREMCSCESHVARLSNGFAGKHSSSCPQWVGLKGARCHFEDNGTLSSHAASEWWQLRCSQQRWRVLGVDADAAKVEEGCALDPGPASTNKQARQRQEWI